MGRMAYQNPTNEVSLTVVAVVALETPSAWTAALSLQVSRDRATFVPPHVVTAPGSVTEFSIANPIRLSPVRGFA